MRKGEKGILIAIAVIVLVFMGINAYRKAHVKGPDKGIPFYTTASEDLKKKGSRLVKQYDCRDCHTLWAVRNVLQHVPSPALDGIGVLRSESWLFDYLSAKDPQKIIPSRLKAEYRMPSYAEMPEEDRHTLAAYLASLKVKNWYLEEVKKSEYEKLTGKTLPDGKNE